MNPVTKEVFLKAKVCLAQGWFLRNSTGTSPPTEADRFRMEQGMEVGRLARRLCPGGIIVPPGAAADAAAHTQRLMNDPSIKTLFEATFFKDDGVAKPDILKKSLTGWDLIEVKSSLEDTQRLDELIDDLAYTVMVVKSCGINVTSSSLMLISRAYRKGMDESNLFVTVDQTAAVTVRLKEFCSIWKTVADATVEKNRPTPRLIPDCKNCEHFASKCLGKGIVNPVTSLPNLHKNRIAQLSADRILGISQLPSDFPLTDTQARVVKCVRTGKPYVAKTLRSELERIDWPAHYLDFESVMTALPLYPDLPPFDQIVTQYSIHRCSAPGKVTGHSEYLADPGQDCQRELAERLLTDLGDRGTIICYSQFEATRITALAKRFPDLTADLDKLKGRLFDLLAVIRGGFYHPAFGGSFSIKKVLPAVVPELSYAGMPIGDGDTAVARFAKMALGRYSNEESMRVRRQLLDYCKQDTLAMVRLHERLLR